MGIFEKQKRAKAKSASPVGVTYISASTPGVLTLSGYHSLTDAPEVDGAIRKIANLVAAMPIHLMENQENGDVRIRDELSRKIDINPWSLGTRQTWVHWIVATMIVEGEAFCIPVTQNGYISDLVPAPGAAAYRDFGEKSYHVMFSGQRFEADDVLHFRLRPDPLYPWKGMGLERQLQMVVDSIVQTAQTKTAYMSSEYKPPIVIAVNTDSPLSDEKERTKFLKKYMTRTDPSEPLVVPSDLVNISQVKPLSLTDLAIRDGVELDKKTVATILGIPAFLVGAGSFSKDEFNSLVSTEVRTFSEIIQQELTKKLLLSPTRYFRMNRRSLMAYSLTEIGSEARENRAAGLITGNEARNEMGYTPMDGLDELVALENYIPVSKLGEQKKLASALAQKEEAEDAQ